MNKISIHGFYGHGNLGDEAILKALLNEFNSFPEINVIVFCSRPNNVIEKYNVKSIHSRERISCFSRIWNIRTSSLFVLGGGGLLKDYGNDSSNVEKWLELLQKANKMGVRTALCAVGVENIRYKDSKKIIRRILNNVDIITVRDPNSKQTLLEIGVKKEIKVISDPALLLPDLDLTEGRTLSMPPKIIICVRHWYNKGFYIENPEVNKKFLESLSIAADLLVKKYNAKINFIPMRTVSYDDDRSIAYQVAEYMENKKSIRILTKVPQINEFIHMISQSSLVIGMRLHSLILSTGVGIPAIGIEYMPKVKHYMKSVNQSEYSLNIERITVSELMKLIEKTFKEYDSRSRAIIDSVSNLRKITKNGIRELIKYVKK